MTNFGDVRSALHSRDDQALDFALNNWEGGVDAGVVEYVIDSAIRTDTALCLTYDMDCNPLDGDIRAGKVNYRLKIGANTTKRIGTCTRELRQRWLLDWVVRPMRLWCVDEKTHNAWDEVIVMHERAIQQRMVGNFYDMPGAKDLWRDTMDAFRRAYADDPQYAHVVHSVNSNIPQRVAGSLEMAMNEHGMPWTTMPKLRASFDMYMLIHGRGKP